MASGVRQRSEEFLDTEALQCGVNWPRVRVGFFERSVIQAAEHQAAPLMFQPES